jgi:putative heme-binding domain-containing protein
MEISYGPDGGVFVLDWSDTGECHEYSGVHRTSGRIYKITYDNKVGRTVLRAPEVSAANGGAVRTPRPTVETQYDIAKLSASELVKLHTHANEWFCRQARLELTARAGSGRDLGAARQQLHELFDKQNDVVVKLRTFWTLYAIGAADEPFLRAQLHHANEHVRTWAIRFLTDAWPLDTMMSQRPGGQSEVRSPKSETTEFVRLARTDSSGLVRLALASTLQRLPVSQRTDLAAALLARKEDARDHNLPLLIWYGLIPVADADPSALARLAGKCELPLTRQCIARRLGEDIEKNPGPLNELLKLTAKQTEAFQADILAGLSEALSGWRRAKAPESWSALQRKLVAAANAKLRDRARELSVVFGDGRALDEVKRLAFDNNADLAARKSAVQTLIDNRPADLREICEKLLTVQFLNVVAVRGLAQFDDPAIAAKLAKSYRTFHATERRVVLDALVSRPAFARVLLAEVAAGRIPRADITAFHARQIRSANDPELTKQLADVWGELREPAADKRQFIARLKNRLTPASLGAADKSQGHALYSAVCANCHRLHGEGGQVGPDLTGAGRDNLDYLLENIVDPSAVVTADFRMSVADLKDGRVLNGIVAAQTERTLTLKTMTETITVERGEIEKLQKSNLSLMPEGLLEALNEAQVRDLVAYLMHPVQVPATAVAKGNH